MPENLRDLFHGKCNIIYHNIIKWRLILDNNDTLNIDVKKRHLLLNSSSIKLELTLDISSQMQMESFFESFRGFVYPLLKIIHTA